MTVLYVLVREMVVVVVIVVVKWVQVNKVTSLAVISLRLHSQIVTCRHHKNITMKTGKRDHYFLTDRMGVLILISKQCMLFMIMHQYLKMIYVFKRKKNV